MSVLEHLVVYLSLGLRLIEYELDLIKLVNRFGVRSLDNLVIGVYYLLYCSGLF